MQIGVWTGDYGVSKVTSTPTEAGLVQIGSYFSLADFTVSKDAGGGCCWFMPYPEIFGCEEPAIPNQRRVFIEIIAGALGQSQITSFSIALVKRYSRSSTSSASSTTSSSERRRRRTLTLSRRPGSPARPRAQ
ncbi:hypothetical protein [Nannocystis pusilla]|uniref:hypothetical protein n=1 Tax=Nannocystis pusilla TaxID=889268 RepID=UPI003B793469